MKPFVASPRNIAVHLGLALLIASVFGGALASAERAIELVATPLLLAAVAGVIGHLRWHGRERRVASRLSALVAVVGCAAGCALLLSPADSLGSLQLYRIGAWRDAVGAALMITGVLSCGVFAFGRRLSPSRWSLSVSPRWLLVGPTSFLGGWIIGWDEPRTWPHALLLLLGSFACVGASAWLRDWLHRKVGMSLHLAAAIALLGAGICAPAVGLDGHVDVPEVVVWLAVGAPIVGLSLWWRGVGLVSVIGVWIALAAAEIARTSDRLTVVVLMAVGGSLIAISRWVSDEVDLAPPALRLLRRLGPQGWSDGEGSAERRGHEPVERL